MNDSMTRNKSMIKPHSTTDNCLWIEVSSRNSSIFHTLLSLKSLTKPDVRFHGSYEVAGEKLGQEEMQSI
jgi:hypothetical protein